MTFFEKDSFPKMRAKFRQKLLGLQGKDLPQVVTSWRVGNLVGKPSLGGQICPLLPK